MSNLPSTTNTNDLETAGHTSPAVLYLAGLAESGRRTMQSTLKRIAAMMGISDWRGVAWHRLDYEQVARIRAMLNGLNERGERRAKPATVNKYLAALRGVAREAWHLGIMPTETYTRIMDVRSVNGATLPAGRALGSGEIEALMRACAGGAPADRRDAAIIALGYSGGLRRAELAALTIVNIESDNGETVTLRITGKRQKERMIYLDNGGAAALRGWLAVRGLAPGALFYGGRRGGHITPGAGMAPQSIRDIVDRRATQAGIQHVSPHDLRRSFVSDLLDRGVDISTVADMAGHANIQTTKRYDRRGEAAKRRASQALHVPYYEH